MTISLKTITTENLSAVCNLKVKDGQKIMSNVRTIAGCYVEPAKIPLAVYNDEILVGFVAYEREENPINYDILILMIDEKFQGKGYGRGTLNVLINFLKEKPDCKTITLNYIAENKVSENLYKSVGFKPTGEIFHDEVIMRMEV